MSFFPRLCLKTPHHHFPIRILTSQLDFVMMPHYAAPSVAWIIDTCCSLLSAFRPIRPFVRLAPLLQINTLVVWTKIIAAGLTSEESPLVSVLHKSQIPGPSPLVHICYSKVGTTVVVLNIYSLQKVGYIN